MDAGIQHYIPARDARLAERVDRAMSIRLAEPQLDRHDGRVLRLAQYLDETA